MQQKHLAVQLNLINVLQLLRELIILQARNNTLAPYKVNKYIVHREDFNTFMLCDQTILLN